MIVFMNYICVIFFQYPKVNRVQKRNSNRLHEYVPIHLTSFFPCSHTLFKHVPMRVSLKLKCLSFLYFVCIGLIYYRVIYSLIIV